MGISHFYFSPFCHLEWILGGSTCIYATYMHVNWGEPWSNHLQAGTSKIAIRHIKLILCKCMCFSQACDIIHSLQLCQNYSFKDSKRTRWMSGRHAQASVTTRQSWVLPALGYQQEFTSMLWSPHSLEDIMVTLSDEDWILESYADAHPLKHTAACSMMWAHSWSAWRTASRQVHGFIHRSC